MLDLTSLNLTERQKLDIALYPTVAHLFFYGLYISLFGVAISITYLRKRRFYKIHLLSLSLLFFVCTISALIRLVLIILGTSGASFSEILAVQLIFGFHFLANLIADALLIHRCYHIWAPNKHVIYLPVLGLVANIGVGITTLAYSLAYYWIFVFITLLESLYLTFTTAGRIWYISRESRALAMFGGKLNARYKVIAAAILESGLIYPVVLTLTVLSLALPDSFRKTLMLNVLLNAQIQIVGITQALIIVHIGLGVDFAEFSRDRSDIIEDMSHLDCVVPSDTQSQPRGSLESSSDSGRDSPSFPLVSISDTRMNEV